MRFPGELIPITLFTVVPLTMIFYPLARALARRIERSAPAPRELPDAVAARLERMEQAIDSIAVEVERISEGQRFTTKLLAERGAEDAGSRNGLAPSTTPTGGARDVG
ncbi:MAG TPA: hypothetical protein VKA84_29425 [Gemmatimonadaceae bacterium]|nr:hypothetical protein [Gemmatimonadaceae bacterium]